LVPAPKKGSEKKLSRQGLTKLGDGDVKKSAGSVAKKRLSADRGVRPGEKESVKSGGESDASWSEKCQGKSYEK